MSRFDPPDAPPPYSPVDPVAASSSSSSSLGGTTTRPPPPPPQPSQKWNPPPVQPPRRDYADILEDNGPQLPWKYPRGYRCSKCNNTGYRAKKGGKPCKKCWEKFDPKKLNPPPKPKPTPPKPQPAYNYNYNTNPGVPIPFTGYRVHDGLRVSSGNTAPGIAPMGVPLIPPGIAPMGGYAPSPGFSMVPPPGARVVRPGDSSIGGRLCPECGGSGRVNILLLFDDLCSVCRGTGRVFY